MLIIYKLSAWTDRIHFSKRTTNFSALNSQLIEYNSLQNILMNAHKPVYSYFNLAFIFFLLLFLFVLINFIFLM